MSYIAAGVAVAGLATSVVGGMQAAGAASSAAKAQAAQAEKFKNWVSGQQNQAVSQVLNPAALAAQDTALKSQTANVNRMNTLAQSLDPALTSAGKQMNDLLQGKSAPVLAEIQNQRAAQRQQLQAQLTQQMGPGGASSSAGQQALQKFDLDTANLMNNTQQQYLSKVSDMAIGGTKSLGDTLNAAASTLDQVNADSPQNKAAQLISQFTNGAGSAAQTAKVNAAGGQFKGQQLMGQMTSQIGGQVMSGAALAAGSEIRAGGTPSTPSTASAPADANQMSMGTGNATPQQMAAYSAAQPAPGTLGATMPAPAMAAGMAGGSGISSPNRPVGVANSTLGFSANYGDTMDSNGNYKQYGSYQPPNLGFAPGTLGSTLSAGGGN